MTCPIRMKTLATSLLLLLGAGLPLGPGAVAQSDKPAEASAASKMTPAQKEAQRKERLKLAAAGLEKLYKIQPEAQKAVEGAAGYAVFDIGSVYAILLVGQKGQGVLFDNASKKPTFMTSSRVGTGPGVGKQRVYQIFVFKSKGAMNQFVLTGDTGVDVSASASAGKDGMVRSFNPSIDIYQVPESGMAVQASWGGTRYSKDKELN